jgi:hypothetical protein
MKAKLSTLVLILLAMLNANLLSAQVKSDYDKEVDFSTIKSYTFKGWAKDSDQVLNDLDQKRITDAFKHELSIRGLENKENGGDADITLYVVIDKKTSTTAYTNYNGGFGYGGRGWGWGGGMSSSTTSYSEHDYNVGTVVIDFYHKDTKKLIWQGVITETIKSKPEKRDKSIPKSIRKLMKKYPVDPIE